MNNIPPDETASFRVKALDASTWPDFAQLVERHNGVWGGCWCMAFHAEGLAKGRTAAQNRSIKEQRVREGRAHAALVYDAESCVGWCQFGPADELPRVKNLRAYERGLTSAPDWRITCFFIDRRRRGRGVASTALEGALGQIARLGGGVVESYPADMPDAKLASGFGFNTNVAMFERHGFARLRLIAQNRWVVARRVEPATASG